MKHGDAILEKIYLQNPETGAFLIEAALDRYEEVFNEWDPAPYKRRDLNPDLRHYLEESSSDIPLKEPVELLFTAPAGMFSDAKECNVREGLATYLACACNAARKDLRRLHRLSLIHLAAASVLLVTVTVISRRTDHGILTAVLRDGLTIGSWVFTWELISLFFFRRFDLRREMKKWRRLSAAQVTFSYRE